MNWFNTDFTITFGIIILLACVRYFTRCQKERTSPNPIDVLEAANYGKQAQTTPFINSIEDKNSSLLLEDSNYIDHSNKL